MASSASVLALLLLVGESRAGAVIDANVRAAEIASTHRATPVAVRVMAIVQVAVLDAVQSITPSRPSPVGSASATRGASVEAAVAAATHKALLALVPTQQLAIEADYRAALGALPDDAARAEGIAAGERAAAAALSGCASDGAEAREHYRPRTTPGVYVPTVEPVLPSWGRRRPWLMEKGSAFRPGPPPALDSDTWRRDVAEIAAMGAKNSMRRTPEQTRIARFWETTSPTVYWPIAREVAATLAGEREQALLLARAAVAMDDAAIAVFDAKYAYEFWRPVTAIRNAPDALRDPDWEPLIETPMHPEYPCAHCIVSAALGSLLEATLGDRPSPVLHSRSPTGGDAERTWANPAEFVREVSEARILDGVHYRNSTEVGRAMGRRIGELAAQRFPGTRGAQPR